MLFFLSIITNIQCYNLKKSTENKEDILYYESNENYCLFVEC
jgi:hypothetical protein